MNKKETYIGKVRSVTGAVVAIELDETIRSTLPIINGVLYRIGQIGSFVKIPLGYVDLFGIVAQAGSSAIPEILSGQEDIKLGSRWIEVILMGERIGERFERGVIQYPIADDEVHLVTRDDLFLIYGSAQKQNCIAIGQVSASENLPATIDIDRLVNRHCAVLGATGSGKSNIVSIILEAISRKEEFPNARIILIDPHGEYGDALKGYSKVFRVGADKGKSETELIIPYWALPFREFIKIFAGNLSEKQAEYIRERILQKKIEAGSKLDVKPRKEAITADSPIPFSVKQLWFELDDFERQTYSESRKPATSTLDRSNLGDAEKLKSNRYDPAGLGCSAPFINQSAQGILSFLDLMRNRLLDQRFKFLFNLGDLTPGVKDSPNREGKIKKDLDSLIQSWIGGGEAVTILDLSGVPSEIMESVSGSLLSIIYEFLFWGQTLDVGGRLTPVLFVLEEAHTYLRAGENSISSRIVKKIAKEGRKYGAGLLLVTQRPSELDETVLSQCGSVIALRMTNAGDRGHIKSSVEDSLGNLIEFLPSLRTGEGLVMGEMVRLPMRVEFNKAKRFKRSDPSVSEQWAQGSIDRRNYKEALKFWRDNKLN